MGIIDHFRVGALVFDDSHFKLFSFEQFYIKHTREQGSINAADGGVIYVLMDEMQQVKTYS